MDSSMRVILALVLAVLALPANAGDYFLVVQADLLACRDRYASVRASAREVIDDLEVAFQDGTPRIRALRAIVMNAQLGFCTAEDRRAFERGLIEIGTRPKLVHERKYRDFVLMVATVQLVEEIGVQLGRKDLASAARKRLEHLRAEGPRWMEYRRTGKWPASVDR